MHTYPDVVDTNVLIQCKRDDFYKSDNDHLKRTRLSEESTECDKDGRSSEISSQQAARRKVTYELL